MKIYNYDHDGVFICESSARRDPLDRERHLIPRHAAVLAPCKTGENEVAVFTGDKWTPVLDYRGRSAWKIKNGRKYIIKHLGPIPEDSTITPPPGKFSVWLNGEWVLDTKKLRQRARRQLKKRATELLPDSATALDVLVRSALKQSEDSDQAILTSWKADTVLVKNKKDAALEWIKTASVEELEKFEPDSFLKT